MSVLSQPKRPVSPIRVMGIVRLAIVGAFAVYLLIHRPPGYIAILLALLVAFVVLPYTLQAVLRSRLKKRQLHSPGRP